jgi:adenosylmethionine-8-amino-7-oxononanoate aminotransferase
MNELARLDRAYVWHPFTQMQDWLQSEPIVITEGRGAVLRDVHGRAYLDANSSIWTNLHGHRHPVINRAIRQQLGRLAHSSALGLANEPASRLAAELIRAANPARLWRHTDRPAQPDDATTGNAQSENRQPRLAKVFYSDDGSTAMEVALKLAYEFARRTSSNRPRFLSLSGAYHGDTVGAVSLGHIDLFHQAYRGLLFRSDEVMSPACYRCPFNQAKPERADARLYRQCRWECVDQVEQSMARAAKRSHPYSALVVEPRIQGAAGLVPQPPGWLSRVAEIARGHGAHLIADEVLTGFGRGCDSLTGLFASHDAGVQPDYLAAAKGMTGGYLPMAVTFATQAVFDVFLGRYDEFKTFFHGHSYTANQLGSAAARANLGLLATAQNRAQRRSLRRWLAAATQVLWELPHVGDIRQVGSIVGVELVRHWRRREPFPWREQAGIRVCQAMARRGVLTRPIGNVIALLPPYCTTQNQVERIVNALHDAVEETLGASNSPS